MKTSKLFSMGLVLPFMAALLYAAEASATCIRGPFRVEYCHPAANHVKDPLYFNTQVSPNTNGHNNICVRTLDVPLGKIREGYACEIKYQDTANFVPFDCNHFKAMSGWLNNIPVRHGHNEVRIFATTKDGVRSAPLNATWYVKLHPETPTPRMWIEDKVAALSNGPGGKCDPLTIPIRAENGSTVRYTINGATYSTARLNELGAPAKPPYLVDYDLRTQGLTSLEPGETFVMDIWAEESIPQGGGWVTAASPTATWTVLCPSSAMEEYIVDIDDPRPRSGYASMATLHFSVRGGANPPLFCSLNSADPADFVPCTSPYSYTGLTAGEQTFRVYATPGIVALHRWRVYPPDVVWTDALPVDSPSTTATFWFAPATGVDVPVTLRCSVNGDPFYICTSPETLHNLAEGVHTFEVQATSSVGTGAISGHTWVVLPGGGGRDYNDTPSRNVRVYTPNNDSRNPLDALTGGCSAAAGMPLMVLAGLWALARRRRT